MTRPMQPSPATSTTFSCQLSSTLMAAPADSAGAPGLAPIWLNPVCWGVIRVGVRGALPLEEEDEEDDDVAAMPLYLPRRESHVSLSLRSIRTSIQRRGEKKEKGKKKKKEKTVS